MEGRRASEDLATMRRFHSPSPLLGYVVLAALLGLSGCTRPRTKGRDCHVAADCEDGDICTQPRCDDEGLCHHDGIDFDGDGHAWLCGNSGDDCNDEDPAIHADATEICNDDKDNDCDGLVDCDDPSCADWPSCAGIEDCDNGEDDDGDRMVDCEDLDCLGDPHCCRPEPESCGDGLDNDCDGLVDCDDPDCASEPHCCVPMPEDCTDWLDNDCDMLIDCMDPDCFSSTVCTLRPELCNDELDNDGDGLTDCGDPDCVGAIACGGAPCIPAVVTDLQCGSVRFANTNWGSSNETQHYSCGGAALTGSEVVFVLRQEPGIYGTRPMLVQADLQLLMADLDLYVLQGQPYDDPEPFCDPGQCVAWSSSPGDLDEDVSFVAWPDVTYFFVVDGADAAATSSFRLQVTCTALCSVEECGNGLDDDCDGFVDCWDPDCAEDPACP